MTNSHVTMTRLQMYAKQNIFDADRLKRGKSFDTFFSPSSGRLSDGRRVSF